MDEKFLNSFVIRDPQIDIEEIRKIIAGKIDQRRREAQDQQLDLEELARSTSLNEEIKHGSFDLIEHYKAAILIKPYKIAPDQKWPSYLQAWLRQQAHNLVIYYINMLGQRQILFNESVTHVIAAQEGYSKILETKIGELEKKIEEIESRLALREAQKHE